MTPHEMLDALSRRTGAALSFNGDGLCRLRFDGRFIVDLEVADDEDAIWLYARLGPLPAGEPGRALMERMMRAHCLGRESGNTRFGLDGEELMAFARVAAAGAGEDTLFTALEDFLDVLAHWADELQQGRWPAP
ncbi:type III secretion system chaperone [Desulfovibrio piger]|uniref:type III secretion system chaperone n=1 Tax=Desulfovibrio piger TaxID=901 RepID=UPI00307EF15F